MLNIISVLVIVHLSIRVTDFEKLYFSWFVGLIYGLLDWLLLPYAYENSLPAILKQIQTGIWADNFMLAISLDVILGLYLCFRALKKISSDKLKSNWVEYLPPLLPVPVLYYINANFFYAFPGLGYGTTGILLFVVISIGLPVTGYLFRWLLSGIYAIIEFRAIINLAIFFLLLIEPLMSIGPPAYSAPLHLDSLGFILLLFVIGFASGFFVYRVRNKIPLKN